MPRSFAGSAGELRADLLGGPSRLLADWDDCFLDGRRIESLQAWRGAIDAGRVHEVRGAFVVAWVDAADAVHLTRDPIGERTLYYEVTPDGLSFSSDLRALVERSTRALRLDPVSVARYLCYAYIPGAATPIEGLQELRPGEHLTFSSGTTNVDWLWRLPAEPVSTDVDEGSLRRALRAELERATARRLPDAPDVGAFLSGGVDSSLVVALAAAAGVKSTAYSISFGEGHRNELEWSAMVAKHCAAEHRVVELSAAEVMARFDAAIGCLSKPNGDPLTVPNHLLFERAAERHRVVLNGEGGDPCFGGPKNQPMLLGEVFGGSLFGPADDPFERERAYLRAHARCYDELGEALTPAMRAALADHPLESELTPWLEDARYPSFVNRLMAMNVTFKGAHHILPKVDALSRAAGVLPRSPLFDRDVVELAFAIPPRLKLRGSVEKHLLKESVRDLLPEAIIERPKSGMLVPVERWFRGPMREFARERLLDGLAPRGIVERNYIESLLNFRRRGLHPRVGIKLWMLLTLESWFETYLPDARA